MLCSRADLLKDDSVKGGHTFHSFIHWVPKVLLSRRARCWECKDECHFGLYVVVVAVSLLSLHLTLVTPRTIARQAPLSVGFSRQEYWSGLPFLSPGDLPDPGIEAESCTLQADSLPSELPGKIFSLDIHKHLFFWVWPHFFLGSSWLYR